MFGKTRLGGFARVLSVCGGCTYLAPATAQDTITLIGVMRDFKSEHQDFGISPLLGAGHVAGNVDTLLDDRFRPMLAEVPGFVVDAQWRNRMDRPIAPHAYVPLEKGLVRLRSMPVIENSADVDTYEHDDGPYDPDLAGPPPVFVTDQTMPEIPTPDSVPASEGYFYRDGSGVTEFTTNRRFSSFYIRNSHTIRIVGDITLFVDGDFLNNQQCKVEIASGSTLTLYVGGRFHMRNSSWFNYGGEPENATIYKLGTGDVLIGQSAEISANLVAPEAHMQVSNYSEFFGTFDGASLGVDNNAGFHVDGIPVLNACGSIIRDREGVEGLEYNGDIASPTSFSQWFRDREGFNASTRHAITLRSVGGGFFEYASSAFYPVDEQLYGNEGRSHNLHFTYQVEANFVYSECERQILELQGTDDMWVFVDDQLLVDLGGIGANQVQVGQMDRLNLVDGQTYTVRIFYAHRSFRTPSFRLRTNIQLDTSLLSTNIPVFAGLD